MFHPSIDFWFLTFPLLVIAGCVALVAYAVGRARGYEAGYRDGHTVACARMTEELI